MKAFVMFLAVAIGAVAGIAASQDAAATAPKSGEVVLYDAGKTIVIRHAGDRVVKYVISPALVAPTEVEVGGRVSLAVEPGTDGVDRVTRLTTLATKKPG